MREPRAAAGSWAGGSLSDARFRAGGGLADALDRSTFPRRARSCQTRLDPLARAPSTLSLLGDAVEFMAIVTRSRSDDQSQYLTPHPLGHPTGSSETTYSR